MKANSDNDIYFLHLIKNNIFTVGENGVIHNNSTNKICVYKGNENNYQRIMYKGVGIQAHRLVWMFFNGSIPEGLQINHIDGKKSNNTQHNLELVTNKQNCQHAVDMGLAVASDKARMLSSKRMVGEKNINAKLTDEDVVKIRLLYMSGDIKLSEIMSKYNLSRRAVENFLVGRSYKKLPFALNKLGNSKRILDIQQVRTIKKKYSTGNYTQIALAKEFKVSRETVRDILTNRTHKKSVV